MSSYRSDVKCVRLSPKWHPSSVLEALSSKHVAVTTSEGCEQELVSASNPSTSEAQKPEQKMLRFMLRGVHSVVIDIGDPNVRGREGARTR